MNIMFDDYIPCIIFDGLIKRTNERGFTEKQQEKEQMFMKDILKELKKKVAMIC